MRWSLPKPEEIRVIKQFAWLPTKLDDNTVVWLESFYNHQRWCEFYSNSNLRFEWRTYKLCSNDLSKPDTGGNNIKL